MPAEKVGGKIRHFLFLGIVVTELVKLINKNELQATQPWRELSCSLLSTPGAIYSIGGYVLMEEAEHDSDSSRMWQK